MAITKSKSSFAVTFDEYDQSKSLREQIEQNPTVKQEVQSFLDSLVPVDQSTYRNTNIEALLSTDKPPYEIEWKKDKFITTKGMWMMKQIRRKFGSVSKLNHYNNHKIFFDILSDMIGYLCCTDKEKYTEFFSGMEHFKKLFYALPCYSDEKSALTYVRRSEDNPCKKFVKRKAGDYEAVDRMISNFDYSFIKNICKKTAKTVRNTKATYYNYFRQKYVRQDEEAAKVIEKKGYVSDISGTRRELVNLLYKNSEDKDEVELCKLAEKCFNALIDEKIAYYNRGRITILNDAIYNGKCPKDYLVVDGSYCEENQQIPLEDRNKVIHSILISIIIENLADVKLYNEAQIEWQRAVDLYYENICCGGSSHNSTLYFTRGRFALAYVNGQNKRTTKGVEHIELPWNYANAMLIREFKVLSILLRLDE